MKIKLKNKKGFSLAELLIVVAILGAFAVLVANFQTKIFQYNRIFAGGNFVGSDAQNVVRLMAGEIRSMSPSSAGAFAIESAGTSTFVFFNDIDSDGLKERIRYFASSTDLKRGVIKPSGNPMTYNPTSETFSTIMSNVLNSSSTPIFSYYNENYDGTATTSLPLPINVLDVRLVDINVILGGSDPKQSLAPIYASTKVSIRSLKDNL